MSVGDRPGSEADTTAPDHRNGASAEHEMRHTAGDYPGRYQWDAVADARRHADAFAMKSMTWRSLLGSVSFEIQEGAAGR